MGYEIFTYLPNLLLASIVLQKRDALLRILTVPIQGRIVLAYTVQKMLMKRFVLRLLPLILVAIIGLVGLTGCSSGTSGMMTGNYRQDTLMLVDSLRTAIALPEDAPEKAEAQAQARLLINDFASRYRRDSSVSALTSFTTMRTALNGLAAHYTSYPNRPVPEKLKTRLNQQFRQVEAAVNRGA